MLSCFAPAMTHYRSWSDGLPPDLVTDITQICDQRSLAHFRAASRTWRQLCSIQLTQMELTPLPLDEFRALAGSFPNVRSMCICRGRAEIATCWVQTEHFLALLDWTALSTLRLESIRFLRPQEVQQLMRLEHLHSLSLPAAQLEPQQLSELLACSQLTSLKLTEPIMGSLPAIYLTGLHLTVACMSVLHCLVYG